MFKKQSPMEKERRRLERQEQAFLNSRAEKNASKLDRLLEDKIPEGLRRTLDGAFLKAFTLIFEKGSAIIELSYNRKKLAEALEDNEQAYEYWQDRQSLSKISKKAAGSGRLNLLLSGAAGVGLGVLGIGLPDIALLTAMMLKGVYEIALSYGYDYKSDMEKQFILLIIQGAVAYGDELFVIGDNKRLEKLEE